MTAPRIRPFAGMTCAIVESNGERKPAEILEVAPGLASVKARRTDCPAGSIAATIRTYTRRADGTYAERGFDHPTLDLRATQS